VACVAAAPVAPAAVHPPAQAPDPSRKLSGRLARLQAENSTNSRGPRSLASTVETRQPYAASVTASPATCSPDKQRSTLHHAPLQPLLPFKLWHTWGVGQQHSKAVARERSRCDGAQLSLTHHAKVDCLQRGRRWHYWPRHRCRWLSSCGVTWAVANEAAQHPRSRPGRLGA
jgi:hypothetical protein